MLKNISTHGRTKLRTELTKTLARTCKEVGPLGIGGAESGPSAGSPFFLLSDHLYGTISIKNEKANFYVHQ